MAGLEYYLEDTMLEGEQAEAYKKRKADEARKAKSDETQALIRQAIRGKSMQDSLEKYDKETEKHPEKYKALEKKYSDIENNPNSRFNRLKGEIEGGKRPVTSTDVAAINKLGSRAAREIRKVKESTLDYYFEMMMTEGEQAEAYKKRKAEEAEQARKDEEHAVNKGMHRGGRMEAEYEKKKKENPEKFAKVQDKYMSMVMNPKSRSMKIAKDVQARGGKGKSEEVAAANKLLHRAGKELREAAIFNPDLL